MTETMDAATYRKRRTTESGMERTIRDAVELLGGRVWHVRDSRALDVEDMPDMIIMVPARHDRPGIVALFETKSQRRTITRGQRHVIDLLADCSMLLTGIVRPVPKAGELSWMMPWRY